MSNLLPFHTLPSVILLFVMKAPTDPTVYTRPTCFFTYPKMQRYWGDTPSRNDEVIYQEALNNTIAKFAHT